MEHFDVLFLLVCKNCYLCVNGFNYNHPGVWSPRGEYMGNKTKAECARICREKPSCVAFDMYGLWECHIYDEVGKQIWKGPVYSGFVECTGSHGYLDIYQHVRIFLFYKCFVIFHLG